MLHIKKLRGMHNKGTYTRVLTYAYTRIDIRVYAHRHTRIRKIRAYNTRMRSSDISELHCNRRRSRVEGTMSFHFRRVFPLICDQSVWHIVKHMHSPVKMCNNITVRKTSSLLSFPILPPPALSTSNFLPTTLSYYHVRHSEVLSRCLLLKLSFVRKHSLW